MNSQSILWKLDDNQRRLWALAVVFYGVGDLSTTLFGLATADVSEIGPIMGPLVERYGPSGIVVGKLGSFVAFWLIWYLLWKPTRVAVPLALIIVGGVVTVWNAVMIVT